MDDIEISDIWPVNTALIPNGGIGIDWCSRKIGFGQFEMYWGDDGKLHADTECMCSHTDRKFAEIILQALAKEMVIDG